MRIELQNIVKYYNEVPANDDISLTIEAGSIHAVLGENGAGKSTLMKVLAGTISMDSGQISINGTPVVYTTPQAAAGYGIGMLYQEPSDFQQLSVLENFMLGQPQGVFDRRRYWATQLAVLSKQFDFKLNPFMKVSRLTVGERQQLELLRLLAKGSDTLILDEPTTGISSIQKEVLFQALRNLANQGKSIVLVSHKLEDVKSLCDQVTVLRQGRVSGEMKKPFDSQYLLKMMFSTLPKAPTRGPDVPGETIIEMNNISAFGGLSGLSGCNIEIRQSEVVGLAGLEGSGQGVFLRVACGLRKTVSGDVKGFGKKMTGRNYHFFNSKGITFLPADRLEEGLISDMSIVEHFALQDETHGVLIPWNTSRAKARQSIDEFRIKGRPDSLAASLSGGNQQRLMLSFLSQNTKLLLLENPTRGLDIESANWVWQYLKGFLKQQASIVFTSSELDEIIQFADRILVFFDGRIIAEMHSKEIDSDKLGQAIAGKV